MALIDVVSLKILQSTWNLIFKSSNVMSEALDMAIKGKLDLSSIKLCDFLKDSISKERRGPMPLSN